MSNEEKSNELMSFFDPRCTDNLLADADDWDHARRNHIQRVLENTEWEGATELFSIGGFGHLPVLGGIQLRLECSLEAVGFDKKMIKDELEEICKVINFGHGVLTNNRWDLNPPYGYPPETYAVSDGGYAITIKHEIEAALLALLSLKRVEAKLFKNETADVDAIGVCFLTVDFVVNALRSGFLPKLIEDGKKAVNMRSRGGHSKKKIGEYRHDAWQKDAEKIWRDYPSYSKWRVAGMLTDKYNDNADLKSLKASPDAISRRIKNPA